MIPTNKGSVNLTDVKCSNEDVGWSDDPDIRRPGIVCRIRMLSAFQYFDLVQTTSTPDAICLLLTVHSTDDELT